MLRSANPDVRVVPEDEDDECDDDGQADDCGERCWWTTRRQWVADGAQRWLIPSARRWVRSALRRGGRLYAGGSCVGGPANFTGYFPHTLLVWCSVLTAAVVPRRWFIDLLLMPGMLTYRAKGREAIVAGKTKNCTTSGYDGDRIVENRTAVENGDDAVTEVMGM